MKKITLLLACVACFSLNAQISDYLTNLGTTVGVTKSGNTLYIGSVGESKVLSVDMSLPNPVPQDLITGISFPTKLVVVGNELYLTYGLNNVGKIDLSAPTPQLEFVLVIPGAFGLATKDNFMYVGDRNNGQILRFDYTVPTPTSEVVIDNLGSFMGDIAFDGNDLYVARGSDGFVSKIDVTQTNPTVENVVIESSVLDVAIDNGFLYYSGSSSLKRINLTDTNPTPITLATGLTSIWDMLIDNEFYIVQQTAQRIATVDINNLLDPTAHPDYSNLLDVYNSLGGTNWSDNVNWLDTSLPIAMWTGVSLSDNGSVGGLNLPNNNLTGNLPATLGNLTNLLFVNLSGNNLGGSIPFNSPTINLDISDNLFDFSDIEPYFTSGNYNSITYSPQRTTDLPEDFESPPGTNFTFDVNDADINRNSEATALNNQYQWFKDNVAISGANASTYVINNAQETDSGIYYCEITNPILPGLTIARAPITLLIDASLSMDTEQNFNLILYPNPSKEWLNIQFGETLEKGLLSIYDVNGRLIQQKEVSGDTLLLNIENLNSGMYILSIEEQNSKVVKRFMKQ
ncbi:T9SS type A sorting domain-containing protein [Winogradskyella sp. DF17]|uniref:T9SS type A sorting domain-containing protein n=1 Tax=Winogradskyella pelagia TaxID=2819984 RepID=A0ABS3T2Y0_9FLAO|nr:T9SS type A sorting domain-containing protein [Winogradskyella sp. DF17]MBO3116246.1 T9SS type A sorting domain-containing protein [Winogradskyella sp. DF17]